MGNRSASADVPAKKPGLKKTLDLWHIWALAVGLVISGEYFGWNYGWGVAGKVGFLIATGIVTLLYFTFIFSYTELTCMLPHAGGPYAYAYKAFGPVGGLIAGYATLMEFLFATPAIAFALGSYIHFLYPAMPVNYTAIGFYVVFTLVNILGINLSALLGSTVTILAIIELLIYMGVITINAPDFKLSHYFNDDTPVTYSAIIKALPYAIWFYLGIEGVAMVSEEVKDPQRTLKWAYILGILTLAVLVFGVMMITGSLAEYKQFVNIDYPLPAAIGSVLGKHNAVSKAFAGLGLFGLVASFHAIIISYSRQIFALARGGYLSPFLAHVSHRFRTPHWALIIGGLVGIVSIIIGRTDLLIILSVLGAVVMYIISMASLFMLRKNEPNAQRSFRTPFYPVLPAIALALSCVCLCAIIYYNQLLSLWFGGIMAVLLALFLLTKGHKITDREFFDDEDFFQPEDEIISIDNK